METKKVKIIKIVACVLVALLVLYLVIDFSVKQFLDTHQYVEYVPTIVKRGGLFMGHFESKNGQQRTYAVGYKSDTRSFDREAVELSVGVSTGNSVIEDDADLADEPYSLPAFEYWVEDQEGNGHMLARVEENLFLQKYEHKLIPFKKSKQYQKHVFRYTEVTLPSEMFADESGSLSITVRVPQDIRDAGLYRFENFIGWELCSVTLSYTRSGDRVTVKQTERVIEESRWYDGRYDDGKPNDPPVYPW